MGVDSTALLVSAGVASGLAGSIAGLASLFSYPALLAVGLPPVAANVTNTVALFSNTVGTAAGSAPNSAASGTVSSDSASSRRWAARSGPPCCWEPRPPPSRPSYRG
ncbi:hypothetical protein SANTM175S_10954 [Streptomyces antimycoticus]